MFLANPPTVPPPTLPTLVPLATPHYNAPPPPSAPADAQGASSDQTIANTQPDIPRRLRDPIPNQIIIQFAPNSTADERAAYIRQLGGRIQQDIRALDAVVVSLPPNVAPSALPPAPIVVANEPDYWVSVLASPNDPLYGEQWGLIAIGAPPIWDEIVANPQKFTVAVIDSGVCALHPDLEGVLLDGWDYVENDPTPQDDYGHGCGVASIIGAVANNGVGMVGVAPNVAILPLRVLDAEGLGAYSAVAKAIVDATDRGATIINLSLGGYYPSSLLQNAVAYATTRGVQVVAAAGNSSAQTILYPAAYPDAIAVGAVGPDGQISPFSNYGTGIDIYAPGSDITAARPDGGYARYSGTSFAAPHVVGAIALEWGRGRSLALDGGALRLESAVPPVAPSSAPEADDGRGSASESDVQLSDEWTVQLQPGTNAPQLAASLGFEYVGPLSNLPDVHIFRLAGSDTSIQAASAGANALATSPLVVFYHQDTIRQPARRNPSDPLFPNQWHLKNTGQGGGTPGVDANVVPVWDDGYDGAGVQIAIVDDGLQYTHPDIAPNYLASASFNADTNTTDPAPNTNDYHGTAVGGVAAAADDGVYCGVGAAYNAQLAGIKLNLISDINTSEALGYAAQVNDIYNNSWGPPDDGSAIWLPNDFTFSLAQLANGTANGRGGLGSIFVWAGGNGRTNKDNVNRDIFANSRYTIAVAALADNGQQAFYSENGAPLLISAPSNGGASGITTTDLLGADGQNSGDCNNTFGGTSSATPLVAGVIALMLEANPNLTWRDVQHILVESAFKNDPSHSDWTDNGAGYAVNHAYGFGQIDAQTAVNLAETWTTVDPEASVVSAVRNLSIAIPDNSPAPFVPGTFVSDSIVISENIQMESVEIIFSAAHPDRGDIVVILEAPSGTQSQLLLTGNDLGANYSNWLMTSMRHWGESSAGTWTLRVADGYPGVEGTWTKWQLKLYGTAMAQTGPTFVVTTTADKRDNRCSVNDCSLREAIIAANSQAGHNTIQLSSGVYALSIDGTGENSAMSGDLDISGSLTIVGVGSGATIIDGGDIDRIFHVQSGGHSVTLQHLALRNGNTDRGGAIYNSGGALLLEHCAVTSNIASLFGGGIYNGGTVTVNDCVFSANETTDNFPNGFGGAIYNAAGGVVTVNDSVMDANIGEYFAGVLYNASAATATFNRSTLSNNRTDDPGGGGAIYNLGTLTLNDSTLSANSSFNGGAIFNSGALTANRALFYDNTASNRGGAMTNSSGSANATFNNVTVSDNHGANGGGGILNNSNSTLTLHFVTFYANTAGGANSKDLYIAASAITTLKATLLASEGANPNCQLGAPIGSNGYNLARDNSCSLSGTADQTNVSANLGALADNGGYVQTHALDTTSPAYGLVLAADCHLTTDARGISRPQGVHCESGAYESLCPTPNFTISAGDVSALKTAINRANDEECFPGLNIITLTNSTYTLNTVDNTTDGPNGLPSVTSAITISGNGASIARQSGVPQFRLWHIGDTGVLTLENLNLSDGDISGQSPPNHRGGAVYSLGQLAITHSTLYNNAAGEGAAIYQAQGQLDLANSTISGNSALIGDVLSLDVPFQIRHSTLAYNDAGAGHTLATDDAGALIGTILAHNAGVDCSDVADITTYGYNISDDGACVTSATDIVADPLLGPLANNGGPTKTHDLLIGSPAFDAIPVASCLLPQDQRQFARPQSIACDIGAVEYANIISGIATLNGSANQIAIALSWNDPWTTETNVRVEWREGAEWALMALLPANSASYNTASYGELACGTAYSFRVQAYDSIPPAISGYSNVFTIATNACPPHDAQADAIAIASLPYSFSGQTEGATVDINDPMATCGATYGRTVWFRHTPSVTTTAWLDTQLSGYDTVLSIWRDDGGALVEVACDDDSGYGATSFVEATLQGGQTYYVLVGGKNNIGGALQLNATVAISPTATPTPTPTLTATPLPPAATSHLGLFHQGIWLFRNTNTDGLPDMSFAFGNDGIAWQPIVGDWDADADRVDTVGLYHDGVFFLRNVNSKGFADIRFHFGPQEAGWTPIVGDWNGDGMDTVGVYKNGIFMLTNAHAEGPAPLQFRFGPQEAGWTPIVGDWNGDGVDTVGVYKNGVWYIRNQNSDGPADRVITFGSVGWRPVVGDWNKDNVDTVGVYSRGVWHLRDTTAEGPPDITVSFGNASRDWLPVAGRWDAALPLGLLVAPPDAPTATPTTMPTLTLPAEQTEDSPEAQTPTHTAQPTTTLPTSTLEPTLTPTLEPSPTAQPSPTPTPTLEPSPSPEASPTVEGT